MMSDARKPTLSLDAAEYRALLLSNFERAAGFVTQNVAVTHDQLGSLCAHLERMKMLAAAWHYAAPPAANVEQMQAQRIIDEAALTARRAQPNGHESPKRKGGWPKGKSRKRPAEAQVQ